ncbi:hypothetical protein, partial [Hyphococcus sp.]|uniref:hypothetical protein n=1 Tax=Hyphococcus sp. TaxID=2038636 RepID=UPI0035C69781
MSQSLPVGAVLNEAFQFGLQRWGTMIRFAWAPLLVGCLLVAGFLGLMLNVEAIMEAGRTGAAGQASDYLRLPAPMIVFFSLVLYVLVSVLFSGIMASVFRLVALGEDIYKLVVKGRPVNSTQYAPISVIPKINNEPVDVMDTENWRLPVQKTFKISWQ